LDELRIIDHCIRGDRKAQKLLYDYFADQMFRVCLRYAGNTMDAEDILITAFFKVFKNIGRFEYRGSASLFGWIKKIMINESLMFLRDSKKII
jgi:RNA polymerase sigma factor (sigma-70 family)